MLAISSRINIYPTHCFPAFGAVQNTVEAIPVNIEDHIKV